MSVVFGSDGKARCAWAGMVSDELYEAYHDHEWGRPVSGERDLFERLSLEAFQSGLSWITILRKRETFRAAFENFEPAVVATFDDADVSRLMADAGIVRNLMKINATIGNAKALLALPAGTTLSSIVHSHAPLVPRDPDAEIPGKTTESAALAKELKKLGFAFVGPTTAYAMMQAIGLVNDHDAQCWAWQAVAENSTASPQAASPQDDGASVGRA